MRDQRSWAAGGSGGYQFIEWKFPCDNNEKGWRSRAGLKPNYAHNNLKISFFSFLRTKLKSMLILFRVKWVSESFIYRFNKRKRIKIYIIWGTKSDTIKIRIKVFVTCSPSAVFFSFLLLLLQLLIFYTIEFLSRNRIKINKEPFYLKTCLWIYNFPHFSQRRGLWVCVDGGVWK